MSSHEVASEPHLRPAGSLFLNSAVGTIVFMGRHTPSFFILMMFWAAIASCEKAPVQADPFPELEPRCKLPKGFEWQFTDGPDFYVWRAVTGKSRYPMIGIYFGMAPGDFNPPKNARQEDGTVALLPVRWSVWVREGVWHREAILKYQRLQLHIWIRAKDKREMERFEERFMACLHDMKLEKRQKPTTDQTK